MTICRPTDHWTLRALSAAPTPMTLDPTIWDEETGAPAMVEISIATVELTCESKLWIGRIRNISRPSVLMIRHPPPMVPTVIATAHAIMTQRGTLVPEAQPTEAMTRTIMPIAFCASLAPWLNARRPDVMYW